MNTDNVDIKKNLEDTFGTNRVKILNNGNYYVKTRNGTEIYVPSNLSKETKIYGFLPGLGGSGNDAKPIRNLMESDMAPNYVTVISPKSEDKNHILDIATKVVTDNNSSVSGVVVNGFSRGARETMPTLSAYLKEHPELGDKSAIVMTDGWIKNYYTKSEYDVLKDNNVQMVYISGKDEKDENSKRSKVTAAVTALAKAGFNVTGVESDNTRHIKYNDETVLNGFVEYLFGDRSDIGNERVNSDEECNYEFGKYNPETGQYEAVAALNKDSDKYTRDLTVLARLGINRVKPAISGDNLEDAISDYVYDIYARTKEVIFNIDEEASPVVEQYKYLKETPGISITHPTGRMKTDGIVSDMDFVVTSMNELRNSVSETSFLDSLKVPPAGEGDILPVVVANINRYFDAVGDLLTMLVAESKSAISISQAWLELDEALAREEDGLGKAGELTYIDPADPLMITELSDSKERVYNVDPVINQKIKDLIGDVDDPSQYTFEKNAKKNIMVIDCEDGKIYYDTDTIEIKPGETKRLIVKLPTNTGMVTKIVRTTAANNNWKYTKSKSDIDPNPNHTDYVDYRKNSGTYHFPSDRELLHTNHYEWIVTATDEKNILNKNDLTKELSQTCEYWTYHDGKAYNTGTKAMIGLNFHINLDDKGQ